MHTRVMPAFLNGLFYRAFIDLPDALFEVIAAALLSCAFLPSSLHAVHLFRVHLRDSEVA